MGDVVGKMQCPLCKSEGHDNSGDNLVLYDDGTGTCFARHGFFNARKMSAINCGHMVEEDDWVGDLNDINTLPLGRELRERGISSYISELYGVRVGYDEATGKDKKYYYPVHSASSGELVGYHVRELPKQFYRVGGSKGVGLFGQHLYGNNGGKFIIICEGQDDALAASQMIYESKGSTYRVVATFGTDGWKSSVEWLEGYDQVAICFDSDDAGKKAAKKLCEALSPGKGRIVTLPDKDANKLLLDGKADVFLKALRDARPKKPSSIIAGADTWGIVSNRENIVSFAYPEDWGWLQEKLGGRRAGQITIWTSGTGSGKTSLLRNLRWKDLTLNPTVIAGVISLEDPLEDEIEGMIALQLGRRFINVLDPTKEPGYREAWEFTHGGNRIYYYDSGGEGSKDADGLISKMRYMAAAFGVNEFYLDHLTLAIAEMQSNGEDVKEEHFMSKLINFVKEKKVHVNLVVQLRKTGTGGKSFESGEMPTLDDLRGSGAIKQGGADIIFFSRDQMAETVQGRNRIRLQIGKCRKTGDTGPAGEVLFDPTTGKIVAVQEEF